MSNHHFNNHPHSSSSINYATFCEFLINSQQQAEDKNKVSHIFVATTKVCSRQTAHFSFVIGHLLCYSAHKSFETRRVLNLCRQAYQDFISKIVYDILFNEALSLLTLCICDACSARNNLNVMSCSHLNYAHLLDH